MNAVRAGGTGNVGAIVNQQSCCTGTRNGRGPQRQFIKHACGQVLFANLNEIDAGGDRSFNEFKEARKLSTGGAGCCRRLAGRDQVRDRRL